jgi:hypothetical protein
MFCLLLGGLCLLLFILFLVLLIWKSRVRQRAVYHVFDRSGRHITTVVAFSHQEAEEEAREKTGKVDITVGELTK